MFFSTERTQMLSWPRLETRTYLPVEWTVMRPHVLSTLGKAGGIVEIICTSSRHCGGASASTSPAKTETVTGLHKPCVAIGCVSSDLALGTLIWSSG